MRTVALSGTNLSSSRLGFGLSSLHHLLRAHNRQALLEAAYDSGIRYFDTSPYYGHGLAERELGLFAGGRRSEILIATKFGIEPDPWMQRLPALMYPRLAANATLRRVTGYNFVRTRTPDYSGSSAVRSLERSLRALRTDYVDILYLHGPSLGLLNDAERLVDSLQGLKSSGKVRYFGLSGSARECADIARRHPGLGGVVQVDAAPGNDELHVLKAAAIPFHCSFGHLRGRSAPVQALLSAAVAANAHGIILFSSRSAGRVRDVAKMLAALEAS
jgi:aryl-alcohol dehydrogenase-like predicted oxidoreductase